MPLISWNTYRKGLDAGRRVRLNPHRTLIRAGFGYYGDICCVAYTVCKGETPLSVARDMYAELQAEKPIDPEDPRVIWYCRMTDLGETIALYYKFLPPERRTT